MSESETPRDPQDPVEQPANDEASEPVEHTDEIPEPVEHTDETPEPVEETDELSTPTDAVDRPGDAAEADDQPSPPASETAPPPPPRDHSSHEFSPPPTPPPSGPPPPGAGWRTHGGDQPPPPPQHRRLTRRSDDRVLAGVASGLGDYFNVDPAIFRLVFVVLTFFGGSGLMFYVLGWLMLPERSSGASVGEDLVRRAGGGRSVVIWIVVAIAALVTIENMRFLDSGFIWALLLIGAGVLFFRQDETARATGATDQRTDAAAAPPAPPSPPPPPAPPPSAGPAPPRPEPSRPESRVDPIFDDPMADPLFNDPAYDPAYDPTVDGWRPTPIPVPPEPPPPPSMLGRITVAVALILGGLLALVHNLTPLSVSIDQYAAVGLAVIGTGLLVGARLGRSHGLIPLGIVLMIVLGVASSMGGLTIPNEAGRERWTPTTAQELRRSYELDAGQLDLDLTELALERGQRVAVDASVDMGQLNVEVPSDVTVDLNATTSMGEVEAFGRAADGVDAIVDHVQRAPEGSPTIVLDLDVGLGRIEVNETSEAPSSGDAPNPRTAPNEPADLNNRNNQSKAS